MNVRTMVKDCLLLNWALPAAALPPPPDPLRYQALPSAAGREAPGVMVWALLSFHEALPLASFPILRLSYPQFSLAVAVTDAEGVPSLLFRRILVPSWVVLAARLVSRQPVVVARLDFDRPSEQADAAEWHWRLEKEDVLEVVARQAAPRGRPLGGSWERDIACLRQRRRGYFETAKGLQGLHTRIPEAAYWPLAAELRDGALLEHCLPLAAGCSWPTVHSAVLFPELPFETELCLSPQLSLAHQIPQPAASRRSSLGAA